MPQQLGAGLIYAVQDLLMTTFMSWGQSAQWCSAPIYVTIDWETITVQLCLHNIQLHIIWERN